MPSLFIGQFHQHGENLEGIAWTKYAFRAFCFQRHSGFVQIQLPKSHIWSSWHRHVIRPEHCVPPYTWHHTLRNSNRLDCRHGQVPRAFLDHLLLNTSFWNETGRFIMHGIFPLSCKRELNVLLEQNYFRAPRIWITQLYPFNSPLWKRYLLLRLFSSELVDDIIDLDSKDLDEHFSRLRNNSQFLAVMRPQLFKTRAEVTPQYHPISLCPLYTGQPVF